MIAGYKTLDKPHLYRLWSIIVEEYSAHKLTFEDDRLRALTGIANVYKRGLEDDFLVGIWAETIPWALGWRRNTPGNLEPQDIQASWTWASGLCRVTSSREAAPFKRNKQTPTELIGHDIYVCDDAALLSTIE
jgi:hypothetical protein